MSDRRDRKGRVSSSSSRSRSRSNHRKKNQKQKHKKNKKYNRSYSRSSSSYSRSPSPRRQANRSGSPSPKRDYGQKYQTKSERVERTDKTESQSSDKQAASLPVQTPGYQPAQEESSCLIITGLTSETTQEQLEDLLRDISISLQTSPPDSIQVVSVFKTAYAVFPSVEAAKKILLTLRGKIDNGQVNLELEFYPTGVTSQRSAAAAKDVSLVQDWICDKCEYKNFAKRTKCHKCENPRNNNCKIVYNSPCYIKQPNATQASGTFPHTKTSNAQDSSGSNNSVMVRGAVLQDISETTLLDFFNQYAPVKDIRMVRNKTTGRWRDFAFIEFFTVEEAERVLKTSQEQDFRIDGQPVTVAFSKTKKREDDYNYGTDEVSPHPGGYQQQNRQYYSAYNATDVNYMNASTDANANYYAQNYYNQYAQQYTDPYNTTGTAANMQQYMQNYGQAYNYNQAYAQGYSAQNYAGYNNYGYDATSQSYARQAYTQQLQQQLQPSTIQQTIQQQPKTQTQQPQIAMPSLSTAATSTPLYQTLPQQTQPEKKPEPLIQLAKPVEAAKVQEPVIEKKIDEVKEKMEVEEKNPEKPEESTEKKESMVTEEKEEKKEDSTGENKGGEKNKSGPAKLSKADEEKNKRKQIELEMKRWEREQVDFISFHYYNVKKQIKLQMGPTQEEQEVPQAQSQQPKKVETKAATQENDKFAPLQVQNKQKSSVISSSTSNAGANESNQPKMEVKPPREIVSYKVYLGVVPVCRLCRRKFNDDYSINLHERFSQFHKENLEKIAPSSS